MLVRLAYGERGLPVSFAQPVDVIEPQDAPALPDPNAGLESALRAPIQAAPLRELAGSATRATIVISDSTRPAPNRLMLQAVLAQLQMLRPDQITILVATGLHRPSRDGELAAMLGHELLSNYQVVNHDARDPANLQQIGVTSSGRPVSINRRYLEADLRITLGLIEPHFFAGFSGGAKLVLPGVAAESSILRNHDAQMVGHGNARWGVRAGNPIFQEQREGARLAGCEFSLNVTIDRARQITGVFAGALEAAHDAGCDAVLKAAMQPVDGPYDVVVASNGGYPLDLNLYQAVKGMSAAGGIVRPGGDVVIVAECRDGTGHGAFVEMLRQHADPAVMLREIEGAESTRCDQWQNQILARVLARARVHLHSAGLSAGEIEMAFCRPCADVAERVNELARNGARVCVLPRGPETVPYLATA